MSEELHSLNIKFGDFHFEGKGTEKTLNGQLAQALKIYEKALDKAPSKAMAAAAAEALKPLIPSEDAPTIRTPKTTDLQKIFKVDEKAKTLSLTTLPSKTKAQNIRVQEAIIIILLGFKELLAIADVMVTPLNKVILDAGLGKFKRISPLAEPLEKQGLISKIGTKKASKYRLTQQGITKALELVSELAKTV